MTGWLFPGPPNETQAANYVMWIGARQRCPHCYSWKWTHHPLLQYFFPFFICVSIWWTEYLNTEKLHRLSTALESRWEISKLHVMHETQEQKRDLGDFHLSLHANFYHRGETRGTCDTGVKTILLMFKA